MSDLPNSGASSTLTIDTQLCFALHSASNAIDQLYRPLLDSYNLTYPQYIVLMALAEQDDISITALAHRLRVSKATMTPLLRRLEAKALITRDVNQANERQKSVRITQEGRALFDKCSSVSQSVLAGTGLTMDQAAELIALCKQITHRTTD